MRKVSHPLAGGLIAALLIATSTVGQSFLTVHFKDDAWDGRKVPAGQQCPLQGGKGATPKLEVSGLPEGATRIVVAFNDETYQPMNYGGHGILGFDVKPVQGVAQLPSAPGNTADLPDGVSVTTASRGTGDYASPGYLPPCSGGNGNLYTATLTALDAAGKEVGKGRIELGHY